MIRLWPVGLLLTVTALLGAALVAYAQLGDSETAGGTIDAAVGTVPPTTTPAPSPTPGPSPTPPAGFDVAIAVGSATAPPNSQVTVDLTVSVAPGILVGALYVTVTYDNAVLSAAGCINTVSPLACNAFSSPTTMTFAMVSLQGISGDVGDITFNTLSTVGTTALTVAVQICDNTLGEPLLCFAQNGVVTIASPTPTPSPTATPGAVTPTPTPSPAASPGVITPTPTPRPHVQGDVDCSGGANPVTAVDALKVLRFVAALPVTQTEPCDDIGIGGPPVQGNVDCSVVGDPVSAVDALKILRFVAGLPVAQNDQCAKIGA